MGRLAGRLGMERRLAEWEEQMVPRAEKCGSQLVRRSTPGFCGQNSAVRWGSTAAGRERAVRG